jgi:hypothetical protein
VIEVPAELDEDAFEELVALLGTETEGGGPRILLDARQVSWVTPYGLIGLLAIGQVARQMCSRSRPSRRSGTARSIRCSR